VPTINQSSVKNRLPAEMSVSDLASIQHELIHMDLPRSHQLSVPGQPIEYCWFIERGIASVVATSAEGREAEVGIVGRDGMLDVATIMGAEFSPLRSFIQIAGSGFRISTRTLRQSQLASPTLQAQLGRYAYDYLLQVAQTALANASFTVEQRLARWLLMCADRTEEEEIVLTHEFLSVMLNVRRAGVTVAIQSLERSGLVKAHRGSILIVDRAGLTKVAQDAYTPCS